MANIISGSFIGIDQSSSTTPEKSYVRQFVDILQSDIKSEASTRKKYEVFVTGGLDQSPVRSSLYQTVFDQDFTLSTANPLLDVTIGTFSEDVTVTNVNGESVPIPRVCGEDFSYDAAGKITGFNNNELMIREKVNIYRQYAQNLLGNPDAFFVAPHGEFVTATNNAKRINAAFFINIKRLFTRDNIFKGSFSMKLYKNGSFLLNDFRNEANEHGESISNLDVSPTLFVNDENDFTTISDSLVGSNLSVSPVAGEVSTLTNQDGEYVGLIYYDKGIIVLDIESVFNGNQLLRGIIDSNNKTAVEEKYGPWYVEILDADGNGTGQYLNNVFYSAQDESNAGPAALAAKSIDINSSAVSFTSTDIGLALDPPITLYIPKNDIADGTLFADFPKLNSIPEGSPLFGINSTFYSDAAIVESAEGFELFEGKLYPDFILKASIDDILDHVCFTRFGDQQETAIVFRNETVINSRLIFCRAAPSQLNYSTNPTYTNSEGEIVTVVDGGSPFSYVTTVGLYDSTGSLVAVAKTSRPIEKNKETDLSIRIRLDF